MSTETQLDNLQSALEDHGGIKEYTVDDVEVKRDSIKDLSDREDILLARRNRSQYGGIATRINFNKVDCQ